MRKGIVFFIFNIGVFATLFAQPILPTLEWEKNGSNVIALGPTLNPIVVNFYKDLSNPTIPTLAPTYTADANPLTATLSLRNQTRSTTLTGTATVLQGITFGGRNTDDNSASVGGDDPVGTPGVQAVGSALLYNTFAAEIPASKPLNRMYVSSPQSAPYSPTSTSTGGSGTLVSGFDTQAVTGAQGPDAADLGNGFFEGDDDNNYGIPVYVTVEPLHDISADPTAKYQYGELVINFNRTVKNPMVHLGGLGGSYTYLASAAGGGGIWNTNFSTELELVNGETPTALQFMAGNLNLSVVGNQILNSNAVPNAGSVQGDATYGAASGTVRVNGTYSQLVFKVYMRGSAGNFGWSQTANNISAANRDPLNGDVWYISVSSSIPTQQISGNVFYDEDRTVGDIWRDIATSEIYDNTNGSVAPGSTLLSTAPAYFYANLLNSTGQVISSIPIGRDGSYLFDSIPTGTYSVGLSDGPRTAGSTFVGGTGLGNSAIGPWENTGQQIGLIGGTDGNNDSRSNTFTITSGQVLPNVNFGVWVNTVPVDLLNFSGVLQNETAKLKWLVENELHFDDYDLERSIDGINFSKIATVNARAIGAAQQTYTYDDNLNGFTGKVYYRLRMNNLDRSFKYSNIVIVRLVKIKTTDIYPNPFTQFIKIEVESVVSEKAQIKITDINGIVVALQSTMLQIGGNQITINNLAKLAQGTYFLEITTSTETIKEKLIKLK